MALFGRKTEDKKEVKRKSAEKVSAASAAHERNLVSVLIKPRITEKAVFLNDKHVYIFNVHKEASKYDVRDAVKQIYKVTPRKIAIVNRPARRVMSRSRGHRSVQPGLKKAYVYLNEGDRIDLA